MKKAVTVFICIALCICCVFAASCGNTTKDDNLFVFLSVRMKGNGDGTVTAVAKNEFALSFIPVPVTLTLFRSDEYETDSAKMTEAESVSSEGLNTFETLELIHKMERNTYYCAVISYAVYGEVRYLQSATVYYDAEGKRI